MPAPLREALRIRMEKPGSEGGYIFRRPFANGMDMDLGPPPSLSVLLTPPLAASLLGLLRGRSGQVYDQCPQSLPRAVFRWMIPLHSLDSAGKPHPKGHIDVG